MVPRAHLSSDLSLNQIQKLLVPKKLRKTYTNQSLKFKVLFGALGGSIIGKYIPTVPQTSLLGSLSEALGPLRSH